MNIDWRSTMEPAPLGFHWERVPALAGEFIEVLVRDNYEPQVLGGAHFESLDVLIARAIELKQGNKEFALFWYTDDGYQYEGGQWSAQIGNRYQNVGLGEVDGEVMAPGKTPQAAVEALIATLRETIMDVSGH